MTPTADPNSPPSPPPAPEPLLCIPNLLSLSRIPLAVALFACVVYEAWLAGLIILLVATATEVGRRRNLVRTPSPSRSARLARSWRGLAACAIVLVASLLAAPLMRAHAEPSTLDRLLATPIPPRDPLDLYARMNGVDPATIKRVVNDYREE